MLKVGDVPQPGNTWLTLDEHPDSIDDGMFFNDVNTSQWGDLPSALHNGACGFSFADGHAEIKKWLSPATKVTKVYFNYGSIPRQPLTEANRGKADLRWYEERTGLIPFGR